MEGDEETRLAVFRRVRDEIRRLLRLFVASTDGMEIKNSDHLTF